MHAISDTVAIQNLESILEKVCADCAPLIITRQDAESVVMMSLADYRAMEDLLSAKKVPKRLNPVLSAQGGIH